MPFGAYGEKGDCLSWNIIEFLSLGRERCSCLSLLGATFLLPYFERGRLTRLRRRLPRDICWQSLITREDVSSSKCAQPVKTHSLPRNETLVPPALFLLSWKTQPNQSRFQTNFLPMKEENPTTSYCVVLTLKSAKMRWLVKEMLVFWRIGDRLFMDDDSEHKVVGSDDVWVFDSE